ncbi:MAG: DUF4332 domain-containing protein [Candidatus Bathyarchaeota archaeon]|nr:MAG: DUF4332 domain-containing protein [Candidatus Bathyarchaeota archaeon]
MSVATLVPAVFNGVIYGFFIWLIYTLAVRGTRKDQPKQEIQQAVTVHSQAREPSQPLTKLKDEKSTGVSLNSLESIGSIFTEKLAAIGITTTVHLLEAAKTRTRRIDLAEKAGISTKLILEWVNLSDLMRVKGVSEQYSYLLKQAGVDTVTELARRNPTNLLNKLREVNDEKGLVKRLPSLSTVSEWVIKAKELPRTITY